MVPTGLVAASGRRIGSAVPELGRHGEDPLPGGGGELVGPVVGVRDRHPGDARGLGDGVERGPVRHAVTSSGTGLVDPVLGLYRSRLYRYRTGRLEQEDPPVDLHSFALLLAYAGSAVGVLVVAPQIVRTVKHPHLGGVSPWSWAISAVACTPVAHPTGCARAPCPRSRNVFPVSGAVAIVLLVPAEWSRARRAWTPPRRHRVPRPLFSTYLSPEQVGFFAFGIGLFAVWPQLFETVWLRRGMGPSAPR